MAVALLDVWGTGLSHTRPAGSDRLLVFIVGVEGGSATPVATAVTYGGQSMTELVGASVSILEGSTSAACQIFYLLETGVNAASTADFAVTLSSASSSIFYSHAFFSGADQSTQPTADEEATNAANHTAISLPAMATDNGGVIIAAGFSGSGQTATWTAPTTAGNEQVQGTNYVLSVKYDLTSGANVTPSLTWASNSARTAMVAASFKPAAAGGAVGSASGTSTASGVGASAAASVGSAAGTSTVSGVGASAAASVGSAAGTSTVSGVGSSTSAGSAVGSAAGTSTASGVGASTVAAVGTAAGTSTVVGVGHADGGSSTSGASTGKSSKRKKLTLNRERELAYWRQMFARIAADDAKAKIGKPQVSELPAVLPRAVEALSPEDVRDLLSIYGLTAPPGMIEIAPVRTIQQINQDAIIALLLAA